MLVDNNKAVYLKSNQWQMVRVKIGGKWFDTFAVKVKDGFKSYTFKNAFSDVSFDKEYTFTEIKKLASQQDKVKRQVRTIRAVIGNNSIYKG